MSVNERHGRSVPFDRSYWVVPGKFLAGCYPGSRKQDDAHRKLKALLEHGIRHVISLMESHEIDWDSESFVSYEGQMQSIATSMGYEVTFDRMPIVDVSIPTKLEMCEILDRIDQSIETNKPVYIHCWGGRGRTGTVVGCFLARHGIASGHDPLDRLQELRSDTEDHDRDSPQTPEQTDFILVWEKGE